MFNIKSNLMFLFVLVASLSAQANENLAQYAYEEVIADDYRLGMRQNNKVLWFFDYSCPYCERYSEIIDEWRQTLPPSITFEYIPLTHNEESVYMARAHYAVESINRKRVPKFFNLMHRHIETGGDGTDIRMLMTLAKEAGIAPNKFKKAFYSKEIQEKTDNAILVTDTYGIKTVPYTIISNRYGTAPYKVNNNPELFLPLMNGLVTMSLGYLRQGG